MIKRNKVTACVVAIAAVMSIIPTGVSAATSDKIKSVKGQVYKSVAYKDGKLFMAGQPKSKDEAAYYLSDGKFNELKDIDTDDDISLFGSNYIEVNKGDYYIDLSNGKISDKNIKEDVLDKAAVSLRSSVKSDNDGRYESEDAKAVKELKEIPKAKFNDSFYETQYEAKEISNDINGGAKTFTVYTGKDGKYIDADYNLGKIKVRLSNDKTANLVNTNDKDESVRGSVTNTKVIAQDSKNIYRLAKITIKTSETGKTIKSINGLDVKSDEKSKENIFSIRDDKSTVSFDVIQVISKSQGSKEIDGIKYSKSVTNYMLCNKDGEKITLLNDSDDGFTVCNDKLINYKIDDDSIEAQDISLKSKSSLSYIETENSDSAKLENGESCVDIDCDGNIWVLTKEYIRKFDNEQDFEKVYSLDDAYSNFSVYDKDNIVVWNEDEGIYAIIYDKAASTDSKVEVVDTTTNTTNNANQNTSNTINQAKWVQDTATGTWTYNNADGTKYIGWLDMKGTWYYLQKESGLMKTGWLLDNGTWYYLQPSGAMKTGWLNDQGIWYYLNSKGSMAKNTTIDGYKLGANGAWIR